MNSAIERLLSLRVADVMHRKVLALGPDDKMTHAGEMLLGNGHSGAPVLDAQSRCVGVLSAVDFVRREAGKLAGEGRREHPECVGEYMTPHVCSIAADVTLIDAAREMCRKHIHRLPVVDRQGRLAGMVSSLDVVAAVVHAVEE